MHDDSAVTTEDGRTHAFDLVVGADGHSSLIRARIGPENRRQEAGYALWRGIVTEDRLPTWLVDILATC